MESMSRAEAKQLLDLLDSTKIIAVDPMRTLLAPRGAPAASAVHPAGLLSLWLQPRMFDSKSDRALERKMQYIFSSNPSVEQGMALGGTKKSSCAATALKHYRKPVLT